MEQAISLKLFPYHDAKLLQRWQKGLLSPGYLFKRPKLELADALILKANCMYELGRRGRNMEYLYQALEAVHLAAALMHCSMDLVPEVLQHLETLTQHISRAAVDILNSMKNKQLLELMGAWDLHAAWGKPFGVLPDGGRRRAVRVGPAVFPLGGVCRGRRTEAHRRRFAFPSSLSHYGCCTHAHPPACPQAATAFSVRTAWRSKSTWRS